MMPNDTLTPPKREATTPALTFPQSSTLSTARLQTYTQRGHFYSSGWNWNRYLQYNHLDNKSSIRLPSNGAHTHPGIALGETLDCIKHLANGLRQETSPPLLLLKNHYGNELQVFFILKKTAKYFQTKVEITVSHEKYWIWY